MLTRGYDLLGRGEFIVVLDSQDRENEGDLIIAAEDVTTEKMSFMVRYTRYYIFPPIMSVVALSLIVLFV